MVLHVLSQSHPCCNSIEVSLVMLGTNLSHSAFSLLPVSSAETLTASSKFEVMFIPGMWRCSSTDFNGLSVAGIPVRKNKDFKMILLFVSSSWQASLWLSLCRWWSINKMVCQKMFQIVLANFKWRLLDWSLRGFLMYKHWFSYF